MLTEFTAGTYLSADSPKGIVNLYTKLTSTDNLDTTSYVGSVQNNQPNGINFGQVIGWRTAKKLVKIKMRVPIQQYWGLSEITEVWADANRVSVYAPALDESAAKFYYCTGNGVRLRSSPSVANLLNVVGAANKGDLLGKSDGYSENNFLLLYATSLNGTYKVDAAGKKISYYVHQDYVTKVNPAAPKTTDPAKPVDTNQPAEGNTAPTVTPDTPQPAANSVGLFVAVGLGALGFVVAIAGYVRRRTRTRKSKKA